MRKYLFALVMMSSVSAWMMSQTSTNNNVNTSSNNDTVPTVVVVEEWEIDSVPLFTPDDKAALLTDSMPTPENLTIEMVEVGVIEPEQQDSAYAANCRYINHVKKIGEKHHFPNKHLRKAATVHDVQMNKMLSEKQKANYQKMNDKMHKRVWYHYVCKNRGDECEFVKYNQSPNVDIRNQMDKSGTGKLNKDVQNKVVKGVKNQMKKDAKQQMKNKIQQNVEQEINK